MPVALRGLLADIADEARRLADRPLAPANRMIIFQLIELLPFAAFVANDSGGLTAANAAACEMTGYDPRELSQLSVLDLPPPLMGYNGFALWQDFLKQPEQFGDYTIVTKVGSRGRAGYAARPHVLPGLHLALMRSDEP